MKRLDVKGKRFGRLIAVKPVKTQRVRPNGSVQNDVKWLCTCDCGMTTMASASDLTHNRKMSCGCLHSETAKKTRFKHGGSVVGNRDRLYTIWIAMKQRCYYQGYEHRKNYSMKGITVCDEWKNDFVAFRKWAYENGYHEQDKGTKHGDILSIDRINPSLGYSPENCQWISCSDNVKKMSLDKRIRGEGYQK